MQLQKWFILVGLLFIIIGILWPFILKLGLGRLPGDIYIKKDNISFYFPIMTCIILSAVISIIVWLLNK